VDQQQRHRDHLRLIVVIAVVQGMPGEASAGIRNAIAQAHLTIPAAERSAAGGRESWSQFLKTVFRSPHANGLLIEPL
jgi:hypothetical protein